MNPHDDQPLDDDRDEERRLAKLLASADKDAAPPDRAFLERLREQSTAAFLAAASSPHPSPLPLSPKGRGEDAKERSMSARRLSVWAASMAATLLLGVGVYFGFLRSAGPAFGQVLDNVARADSVHLKLTRHGRGGELWATHAGKLRWNDGDGLIKIADGDRLWLIDEKAQRKMPQHSVYFHERAGLDLLALLELPEAERQQLLQARPVRRIERDGLRCNVYDIRLPDVRIEALVDVSTQLLHALTIESIHEGQAVSVVDLTVLAYNEPVDEDKFVVSDKLSEDSRLGKVVDAQGIVAVKPVMHERWTPIVSTLPVRSGDWLRTDARGGNALAVRLDRQTGVILGPGSLVELIDGQRLRLLAGEVEISAPAKTRIDLLGPLAQKVVAEGRQHYRLVKDKLVKVDKEPMWLKGFKGTTANESLGSLIATVEGRNVPLTVGYHKVSVDIRDQIARTVIEESFVNHTDGLLEGVFHFPLPQDASISGFGMWIGDQLVEADVVEKQRAREIYETILREKRDPGLLEWSGGNIFKARVYPIFAHSEKRIKITYTQVLPMRGSRYTYSYALQSEMLKQHPLRDLAIDVKINSAVPLKNVDCPTHGTRNDRTRHSAHVEFHAQEYTPERDFELAIDVDGKQAELVVIPHRRGDDGYFMLQLLPSPLGGAPQATGLGVRGEASDDRPLLPNGAPLNLLILADTSASIDAGQRANQAAFLASLLTSLTPKDTFNLAGCDVDCDWVFDKPQQADDKNLAAARSFLAQRQALGWTDLTKAFTSAFKQADRPPSGRLGGDARNTHIIYLGDGIVAPPWQTGSGGGADPVGFARRLRQLYKDQGKGTAHAVALGSSFESGVLKAMASLGGGSVRRLGTTTTPAAVALELLREIAQPNLRDVKLEFKGLRTARVYPEELPNIPAGTQQIILGRYLPDGKDQTGEIIVSGSLNDKSVKYSTTISLKDAESGNSFIPRLWARMHLDVLLEQGASETIRDEIIALSEEYNIITPYTSLLVLESDADRERFKVKRRFQMRDGERFFAQGRDNANYDLRQEQMKKAGTWRVGLRRTVLQQLSTMGRDARVFQGHGYDNLYMRLGERQAGSLVGFSGGGAGFGGRSGVTRELMLRSEGGLGMAAQALDELSVSDPDSAAATPEPASVNAPLVNEARDPLGPLDRDMPADAESQPMEMAERKALQAMNQTESDDSDKDGKMVMQDMKKEAHFEMSKAQPGNVDEVFNFYVGFFHSDERSARSGRGPYLARDISYDDSRFQHIRWIDTYFPQLAPAVAKRIEPKSTWPAEAKTIAHSLLRTDKLAKLSGGIAIDRKSENFEARYNELASRSRRLELFSLKSWLTRAEGDGTQTVIDFCDAKERGVWSTAFQLGRLRKATPEDLEPPLDLHDYSLSSLDLTFVGYTVKIDEPGQGRKRLLLTHKDHSKDETRILIDTDKHVILSIEGHHAGKVTATTKFDDFVEIAGCWWARKIETTDEKGKAVAMITQTIEAVDADAFAQRVKDEMKGRDHVQFLTLPLPKLVDAKAKSLNDKSGAGFEHELVLFVNFARSQQWTRAAEHLKKLEALAAGKPGMRWLRDAFLSLSRGNEELRKRLFEEAARLAKAADGDQSFFLAEHLVGQASGILQSDEMYRLLGVLEPVYQKQSAHVHALKRWLQQRGNHSPQAEEANRLYKQLAVDYPRDQALQNQYAQRLANQGEYPAAYAWITAALANKEAQWYPHEEESLRQLYTQLLEQQGRVSELADYLAEWVKLNPATETAYHHYLSALIRIDQVDKAHTLMAQWLREGLASPERQRRENGENAISSRLQAAIHLMLGQGHNLHTNRIEQRWLKPLADAVLVLGRHDASLYVAGTIMQHHQFQQTDECRRVRRTVTDWLTKELDKLTPTQIQHHVGWIMPNDPDVTKEGWKQIAAGLKQRWTDEKSAEVRHQLGQTLVQVLSQRGEPAEYVAFLRQQWQQGPEAHRTQYAHQLFDGLLAQAWSAEYEDEALALLDNLSGADNTRDKLFVEVASLYRLTDAMVQKRFEGRMKEVKEQEKLARIELRKKQDENRRAAREGFSERLKKEMAARKEAVLAQWLRVERLFLEVQIAEGHPDRASQARRLNEVAGECVEFLGAGPRKFEADEESPYRLEEILRDRYLMTLVNVAARKALSDQVSLQDRVIKYLERGISDDPEEPRWKALKYQVLIALDRAKDLEATLRGWIEKRDADSRWKLALGFLVAEQGRIEEAIKLFESIENKDELGPIAYRSLADWYMVVDRREQHERAQIAAFKTMEEYRLHQLIQVKFRPWGRGGRHLPSELDKDVLLMFAALFEKSAHPQNYLYQLSVFYQASRDFRLLSGLADAVIGQSAGKVYPFLQGMQQVLGEVRDEATADELFARIAKVRERAKTTVDQRALDLLEVLVRRRAAELKNQPGPHVEAALAALQRAFKRDWRDGETVHMGDFLAGLGAITPQALAKEQVRQLDALHAMQKKGTFDRLRLAHRLAQLLAGYNRATEAIDLLYADFQELRQTNPAQTVGASNDVIATLVSLMQSVRHHARGEKLLLELLKNPFPQQQHLWLTRQLYQHYHHALQHEGEVSLGKGAELYKALEGKIIADLATTDHNHRYALVDLLCNVYRTARDRKIDSVRDDLIAFASKKFPEVLKLQTNNYETMVSRVAQTMHDLLGPRPALGFLLDRIEQEPAWFRFNNQDGWSRHAHTLAVWRMEAKDLGDLEPRLLKLVLSELRRDLESGQQRQRVLYHAQNSYYWTEKADAFARVAEEVLSKRLQSGAGVQYIADYFYHGLGRHARAIDILFAAHKQKLLDEGGQWLLVTYLHYQNRHDESIAVLLPLIEKRPEALHYRVSLMTAYFHTGKHAELQATLKAADTFFHQKDRWNEQVLATLASACLNTQLYNESVAYYNELIPLHQRSHPGRGVGDETLSSYYGSLAHAYAGLNKTAEAVDAASGAIVAWGPTNRNRTHALEALKQVLRQSPDLDGYVTQLDKQSADTGLNSPIVRKAIGQVYLEKEKFPQAIAQLQLAVSLQPNDLEIHQALLACYDRQNDREGAIKQLLETIQLQRRDIKLYQTLGERYEALQQGREAERAYTSIVEMLPSESESHTLLAEVRQRQNRWSEAVVHWEQVALIRALEPTGLEKLAEAQIHLRQWDKAADTVKKLRSKPWPARFSEVPEQIRKLDERIQKRGQE